ncbi:MAG: Ig-like domain-containing protein [Firmicutes bacterium]|nr:Ig-like domain-containing protein [Bacillota bacterium]
MFSKRIFALLAALFCLAGLPWAASAAEVDCDDVYCFSGDDFAEAITGICITELPDKTVGSVMLGSRVLVPGDVLTAEQAAQMTFCPRLRETDSAAQVGYLPILADSVASSAAVTIGIRGKENKAPVAEDSAVETYQNLAVEGKLKVTDPEGEAMTFTVVRQGRRGSAAVNPDGSFTYTPKKNKVGVDSFTFTATDASGKTSREATVTITILKPSDATQYTDTLGRDCRFTAEWMKNTGIFVGETVAGNACFHPDREVSRGEFLTMLVKTLELPVEEELTAAVCDDDVPAWLQPYLAAALRSGLTAGLPEQQAFGAEESITGAEAGVMLTNALNLTAAAPVEPDEEVPAWAAEAMAAAGENGFDLEADAPLTREDAARILYQAFRLTQPEGLAGKL